MASVRNCLEEPAIPEAIDLHLQLPRARVRAGVGAVNADAVKITLLDMRKRTHTDVFSFLLAHVDHPES